MEKCPFLIDIFFPFIKQNLHNCSFQIITNINAFLGMAGAPALDPTAADPEPHARAPAQLQARWLWGLRRSIRNRLGAPSWSRSKRRSTEWCGIGYIGGLHRFHCHMYANEHEFLWEFHGENRWIGWTHWTARHAFGLWQQQPEPECKDCKAIANASQVGETMVGLVSVPVDYGCSPVNHGPDSGKLSVRSGQSLDQWECPGLAFARTKTAGSFFLGNGKQCSQEGG